jgi:carbonic anhydrase
VSVRDEVLQANQDYASDFEKGDLAMPPARRLAVVTCMDARIDPARALGLEEGDAHVIRNAGGLVNDETIRSLCISHSLLGTEEAFVIAHTDCGMLTFSNEDIHAKLADEKGADASDIDFQPFGDLEESVRQSVAKAQASPLLSGVTISGWVYDVRSGALREVV